MTDVAPHYALERALKRIAAAETAVFDEDLQTHVIVSMDADEMSKIAQDALTDWERADGRFNHP